ncbi:TonB-dependent receptor [Sinomicrobium pectinilyticum]|uniref:TonB-dependent receptor n=1 Tax=Sinomicrobium pectinilyticum TaxID=1084421 RepID=A0A3N0F030_SINP1|nr:TonB-dependent receptor [Sinomicrobium pectinilyticum]RNL93510.1 TonB-dependent receptor [Sinomicrobium pectinilyticum]
MKTTSFAIIFLFLASVVSAQSVSQIVKGRITDRQTEMPLMGATVEILTVDPVLGVVTDTDGYFRIEGVPLGRHDIRVSYMGYTAVTLPSIRVMAGKEVVVNSSLEESIVQMDEVVVTSGEQKGRPRNEMAAVSARSFSLEEVTRFSGAANDASRMAANYAGVNINNDSRNDLVIRGNSPIGVLWRLEGIPIPNPNHFSTLGTTGGPVSALNTNLLSNSDFLTGAFPAEYGNANAGVFDIRFRNGNRDRLEATAQLAAFSGLEAMIEGPLLKKNGGSFVVSYRQSFVELAQNMGLEVGTTATPGYNDLSFKVDTGYGKFGRFTLFGIGGASNIFFDADDVEEDDFFANQNEDADVDSRLGVIGLNHHFAFNENTYLKTSLAVSGTGTKVSIDRVNDDGSRTLSEEVDDNNTRYTFSAYVNSKFSAKHTFRSGVVAELYTLDTYAWDTEYGRQRVLRDFEGTMALYQAYAQSRYKFTDRWELNTGIHVQYLNENEDFVVEPRLSLKWRFRPDQSFTAGFGVHHQMLPLPVYLLESVDDGGQRVQSNIDLGFLQSLHYVLGYDLQLSADWRLKAEVYYQDLRKVPVDPFPSSFTLLNVGDDFGFPDNDFLVNEGSGRNYGVELTLEKFFSKGYYGLFTGSWYDSGYKGSDGISRNTAFNNRYILNFLAGKEFLVGKGKRNIFNVDMKFTTAGGRYYTPIDLEGSMAAGREVKFDEIAYSERFSPYLRLDIKVGFQWNSKKGKLSQQFYLDFQNITNRDNIFLQRYNESSATINTLYQRGFFPDILYRIQF